MTPELSSRRCTPPHATCVVFSSSHSACHLCCLVVVALLRMPPVLSSRRRTPPHAACAVWSCRRTPPHATCVVWSSSSCMHIIPSMPPPPSPSPCSGQHTALISDTSDAVMSEIFGGRGVVALLRMPPVLSGLVVALLRMQPVLSGRFTVLFQSPRTGCRVQSSRFGFRVQSLGP